VIRDATRRVKDAAIARVGPAVARRQPTRVDLPHAHWGLSVGANGTLWSAGVDLDEVARTHGTPLHVVRADRLDANADAALTMAGASPGVDAFYSYKTNPVPAVLRRLHERGVGAEVISPYELWLALRLGVPPERIVYNGPAKSPASLVEAIDRGVLVINANSSSEAERIAAIAGRRHRSVNLGIRVNLPGTWGGQFGIAASSPQLVDAIERARRHEHVALRALHFHRGLTIRDGVALHGYLGAVLACCDDLRSRTGWHPELLDIGGSLACPTVSSIPHRQFRLNRALGADLLAPDPLATIGLADATRLAARRVEEHFASRGLTPPRLLLEPGRALTADTQLLLTTVLDVKDDGELPHVVLDAGINVAEPVPNEYHQLFSASAPAARPSTPYRLVGPICTPADVLYNHWRLPRLEPGHVLAIMDSGAYFVPFSTSFSFPRAAIAVQDGDRITIGRRHETFHDLVALDGLDDDERAG